MIGIKYTKNGSLQLSLVASQPTINVAKTREIFAIPDFIPSSFTLYFPIKISVIMLAARGIIIPQAAPKIALRIMSVVMLLAIKKESPQSEYIIKANTLTLVLLYFIINRFESNIDGRMQILGNIVRSCTSKSLALNSFLIVSITGVIANPGIFTTNDNDSIEITVIIEIFPLPVLILIKCVIRLIIDV